MGGGCKFLIIAKECGNFRLEPSSPFFEHAAHCRYCTLLSYSNCTLLRYRVPIVWSLGSICKQCVCKTKNGVAYHYQYSSIDKAGTLFFAFCTWTQFVFWFCFGFVWNGPNRAVNFLCLLLLLLAALCRTEHTRQIILKQPSAEVTSKLGWVPSSVVKAMGFRQDWALRAIVLQLMDELIVCKREWNDCVAGVIYSM